MSLLHTDQGPCEYEIKRLEAILDKGLVISLRVSFQFVCVYFMLEEISSI